MSDPAKLDPRFTLARPDLAAASLEGQVPAAAYRPTTAYRCIAPAAAVRSAPDAAVEQCDQLLFGEIFDVLEDDGGWAWGQARRDGYVGFVAMAQLAPGAPLPTHRIGALRAYAFAALACVSLPSAISSHSAVVLVSWISQTFLQLVLLPIIIVGQNIQAAAADARSQATYDDAAAVLEEAKQIQAHLEAQDQAIEKILASLTALPAS